MLRVFVRPQGPKEIVYAIKGGFLKSASLATFDPLFGDPTALHPSLRDFADINASTG